MHAIHLGIADIRLGNTLRFSPYATACVACCHLGRGVQHARTSARASRRCRSADARGGGYALGFGPLGAFLNVTLPIGGRIALPSSINTYISVVKNTSLVYVIGYPELTTTAINIANLSLETLEALNVLGLVYLTLVWSLSAIRVLESRLALPEARR